MLIVKKLKYQQVSHELTVFPIAVIQSLQEIENMKILDTINDIGVLQFALYVLV